MKKLQMTLCAVLALCAFASHGQTKTQLQTLQEAYAQYVSGLDTKYDGQQNALDASLMPRLDALEKTVMQNGDLDGVLAVRKVRGLLDTSQKAHTLLAIQDAAETPELRRLFTEHQDARAAISEKQREDKRAITLKYAESLDKLKRKLVTEDKIADAMAVQKEIEALDIPEASAAKPAPQPVFTPQPTPPPGVQVQPVKPAIDSAQLFTSADLANNIQALAGKPVRFYGRLINMERDNDKRLFLTFDGGIRIRQDLLNLTPLFNSGNIRYDNFNLNQVYVFRIGNTFLIETTLTQTPALSNPTTYRNATIRGCNEQTARNYLKVTCQAPCPATIRESAKPCAYCK